MDLLELLQEVVPGVEHDDRSSASSTTSSSLRSSEIESDKASFTKDNLEAMHDAAERPAVADRADQLTKGAATVVAKAYIKGRT